MHFLSLRTPRTPPKLELCCEVRYIRHSSSYPDLKCGQMLHNFGIRQRVVAHRRGIHSQVFGIRFLRSLDTFLRDKPRYRGELSSAVHDALVAVDLNTVELIHLQPGHKAIGKETQVVLPQSLCAKLRKVAQARKCSKNLLVNSALVVHYGKQSGGDARPRGKEYEAQTEEERKDLQQRISEVSALQPYPDAQRGGKVYEYDPNLKATVKVTPEGDRIPIEFRDKKLMPATTRKEPPMAYKEGSSDRE
jgi:hypothetical protein